MRQQQQQKLIADKQPLTLSLATVVLAGQRLRVDRDGRMTLLTPAPAVAVASVTAESAARRVQRGAEPRV